jgi:hypothetical protein
MGFAGLNIDELKRAFAKERIEAEVVEDDRAGDHCVLKLIDMRYPHAEALLYYENMGVEPRLAFLKFGSIQPEADQSLGSVLRTLTGEEQSETLQLLGRRRDDIPRIVEWVADKYRRKGKAG